MCRACRNSNSLKILCKCTIFDTLFCKYAHIGEKTEKRNLLQSPWNHVKRVTPCSCLMRAFRKCNQVRKKLQMHFLVWYRCSGSPSSLPKQFPWVLRQPKQFAWAVCPRAQATQAVCPLYFCLGQFALRISMWDSLLSGFPFKTVYPWDFCLQQFALGISTQNSLPLGILLATVCP